MNVTDIASILLILLVSVSWFKCITANESEEHKVIDKGDGLIVKIIKEKKNCKKIAEIGDHLSVHYVGRLSDENGKIFDESRPRGQEFKFQLGAGQVSHK